MVYLFNVLCGKEGKQCTWNGDIYGPINGAMRVIDWLISDGN